MPVGYEEDASGLYARIHVAQLDRGVLRIPEGASPIYLEIGTSDRNTADEELLPHSNTSFLVSFEPVIDKYARGLARDPQWRGDHFQPLGHHHRRGLVLPFAVGPSVGIQTLRVGSNSGCSSLLHVENSSNRLKWCKHVKERRQVPSVTLEHALRWVNRTVDFIKIDAQGLDLGIIESAGPLLGRVRRFSLEVVSDWCDANYAGQQRCSEVVSRAAGLGFVVAGEHVPCRPRFRPVRSLRTTAYFCEMELLFVRAEERASEFTDEIWQYHNPTLHGCAGVYKNNATDVEGLARRPEDFNGTVALTAAAGFGIRYYGTGRTCRTSPQRYSWARGELPWDRRQPWTRLGSSNSFGRNYICPSDQVEPFDQDTQAETVLFNFSAVGARTQAARAERRGAGGQGQADTTVHGPRLQL